MLSSDKVLDFSLRIHAIFVFMYLCVAALWENRMCIVGLMIIMSIALLHADIYAEVGLRYLRRRVDVCSALLYNFLVVCMNCMSMLML